MKTACTTTAKTRSCFIAVSLLCTLAQVAPAAYSQESAGVEQDYLLPPEVVPLDPATANSMTASQVLQRQQQASAGGGASNVPGLVDSGTPSYQSAQDIRKQMFNSLYNQPAVAPTQWNNQNQNQYQGQYPGQNQGGYPGGNQNAQVPGLVPAQQQAPMEVHPSLVNQNYNQQPPQQVAQGQGQTLTGPPKSQPVRRDIIRRGFSNVLSSRLTMGAGFILGSALGRGGVNPLYSAGMYGLGMNGIGNRNAFRF